MGVMAIEHADFEGVERLALVTGGEIASTFDSPDTVKLGQCQLIEEVMIGEDKLIKFSGVAMGEACTIVLRGATKQILDEADRSLHDALCVLTQTIKETRTVYGGGCSEMLMANAIQEEALRTPGKEAGHGRRRGGGRQGAWHHRVVQGQVASGHLCIRSSRDDPRVDSILKSAPRQRSR